jgi:hypothetical protein
MANPAQTIFSMDDELVFGKYEGSTLLEVVETHPRYAKWLLEEDVIEFDDDDVRDEFEELLDEALDNAEDRR